MGVFNNWPFTDVHQLNLDFILNTMKEVKGKTDQIDSAVETATTAAENAAESEQNAKASEEASADYYTLTSRLVGKPLAANTAAEMTDITTVYIYTGDEAGYEPGHWYYYNGTAWADGGLYGGNQGISNNARNLLKYVLDRVAYTEPGMNTYVNALYQALAYESGTVTTYMIINALTHVTNNNDATGCNEGDSYTATLTADTNYRLGTVTVTMGGRDITAAVYNNGQIYISSVTGDVTITAVGIGVPDDYTVYDYIYYNGADSPTYVNDAIINTATYNDLQNLIFDFDFMPKISVAAAKSIMGGRTTEDNNGISFYGRTDTQRVSVFSHGAALGINDIPNVVVNSVAHVNLNPHASSPSTLTVDSLNVSEAWINSNVINTPVGYCGRCYPDGNSTLTKFAAIGTLRLYDLSNNLVGEYIPCIRNADNVMGIYDTITESFYTANVATYATIGNVNCVWEVGNWN